MSDIESSDFSGTDANNNSASPNGFPEGMLPSGVNNSARAVMGAVRREFDRTHFTLTSGGTSSAFTLTPSPAAAALANGQRYGFIANAAPSASATLNVNSLGAKAFKKRTPAGLVSLGGNDWVSGDYIEVVYNSSATAYVITNIRTQRESFVIAVTTDTAVLAAGTSKFTFRMPYAFVLLAGNAGIRASLVTAQSTGNVVTVDVNESGSTILSTKLTFDNTEKTTTTAATPPVLSDTALADDAEITFDIDQVGDGTAKGLKVTFIGYQVST